MKTPRVLLSLLTGKPDDLNLARRKVPHDRLVLIVHPGAERHAEEVRAREERLGMADRLEIVPVSADGVARLAATLEKIIDGYRGTRLTLNAAGGSPALATAALYTAYARGVETWFFQEGRADRLPILHGLELRDRVDAMEGKVLLALPAEGATSRWLAETQLIPREKIEKAFRGLKDKGLVVLSAHEGVTFAATTENGRYVRDHLAAERTASHMQANQSSRASSASSRAT